MIGGRQTEIECVGQDEWFSLAVIISFSILEWVTWLLFSPLALASPGIVYLEGWAIAGIMYIRGAALMAAKFLMHLIRYKKISKQPFILSKLYLYVSSSWH